MLGALQDSIERIARAVFWREVPTLRRSLEREYSIAPTMFVQLDDDVKMPTRAHDTDAGLDLYAPHDVVIPARESRSLDIGVHVQLPHGTAGFLRGRSGLDINHCVVCSEGTIDAGYTNSINARIYNHGEYPYTIHEGDRFAQLLVVPVLYPVCVEVDAIKGGERGDSGLGSTGDK